MAAVEKPELNYEARDSRRLHTFFAGKVVLRDGSHFFACVIRELSETGARIELPASRLIPKRLYLLSSKKLVAYDTELVWRMGNRAGLKIHSTIDLSGGTDPQLEFLKQLSAGLCGTANDWS